MQELEDAARGEALPAAPPRARADRRGPAVLPGGRAGAGDDARGHRPPARAVRPPRALGHHHAFPRRALAHPAARRLHARASRRRRAHRRRHARAGSRARRPRRGDPPRPGEPRRAERGAAVRRARVSRVQPEAPEGCAASARRAGRPAPPRAAAVRRPRCAPSVAALAHLAGGRATGGAEARGAPRPSRATSRSSPRRSPATAWRSGAARW